MFYYRYSGNKYNDFVKHPSTQTSKKVLTTAPHISLSKTVPRKRNSLCHVPACDACPSGLTGPLSPPGSGIEPKVGRSRG